MVDTIEEAGEIDCFYRRSYKSPHKIFHTLHKKCTKRRISAMNGTVEKDSKKFLNDAFQKSRCDGLEKNYMQAVCHEI